MLNVFDYNVLKDIPKELATDVKNGVKTLITSNNIQKKLDEGVDLKEILAQKLPNVPKETIDSVAEDIQKGVTCAYDAMDTQVDETWVKQHLNQVLGGLNNEGRAKFLCNLILAGSHCYNDIVLTEDDNAYMLKIEEAKVYSDEEVQWLLDKANWILAEHAGLLKRQAVYAMEKRMHKTDHNLVEESIDSSKMAAIAYASACYVSQQYGEDTKVGGKDSSSLSPRMLGNVAAVSLESSKLMELYSKGKITRKVLSDRLYQMYLSAITFLSEHLVEVIARGMQAVATYELFVLLLLLFAEWLYFAPVSIIVATALLGAYVLNHKILLTTQDYVDVINGMWELTKLLWSGCKNLVKKLVYKVTDKQKEDQTNDEHTGVSESPQEDEQSEKNDEDTLLDILKKGMENQAADQKELEDTEVENKDEDDDVIENEVKNEDEDDDVIEDEEDEEYEDDFF